MSTDDDRPKEGHDDNVQTSPQDNEAGTASTDERPIEPPAEATDEEDTDVEIPSLTPSVRAYVRISRGNECELCSAAGKTDNVDLEIHHRSKQANGGSNHPDNLMLLCRDCHSIHHGNEPIEPISTEMSTEETTKEAAEAGDEPLPPHSEPNETDGEILSLIEAHGPLRTGDIAAEIDCSKQYVRRQCWKLSGEQLIARLEAGSWELKEKADNKKVDIGLPDDPRKAKRAGRDEIIRRMSASGMAHTEISEITDYSRSTVDIAVNRARALRIDDDVDVADASAIDMTTVATRLSALLDLIDHSQMD